MSNPVLYSSIPGMMRRIRNPFTARAYHGILTASVMFSDERKEVMRLLHQVVSGVEKMAVELGFRRPRRLKLGGRPDFALLKGDIE